MSKVRQYDNSAGTIEYDPGDDSPGWFSMEVGSDGVEVSVGGEDDRYGRGDINVPMAEFVEFMALVQKKLGLKKDKPFNNSCDCSFDKPHPDDGSYRLGVHWYK